jgi:transcriptional regulator with GAF, ATPase, and Fis domain
MCELRERVRTVARAAVPVLILGETGVGKELVAGEVHRESGRRGPFVAVNCAALPAELVESELFGHVKGAFTGATGESKGLFGEADGGTLFLDEIGEMPFALQAKLLRALATGEVRAVGAATARTVDVRVVAATNVLLDAAVEEKRFRGDLHARLLGSVVPVPPLRERRADILVLVDHFLAAEGCAVEPTPDAAEALLVHRWPYNVRELEQIVRAAAPDAREAGALGLDQLPPPLRAPLAARTGPKATPPPPAELPILLRVRRDGTPNADELREVLTHFEGNVAQVAAYFGRDRRQVYRWAERLGVELAAFRDDDPAAGD